MKKNKWLAGLLAFGSYVLVAAVASAATLFLFVGTDVPGRSKLEQLEALITECFIGEADKTAMEDAAAAAMIGALGDRWSYYIPAADYAAYVEQMKNAYVGIGVTILTAEGAEGFEITRVDEGGGAAAAGIQAGDVIVEVEGERVLDLGLDTAKNRIRGDEGTQVSLTVLRDGERLTFSVARQTVQVVVARGQLLENGIGLITITNFDDRCAAETLAAIEQMRAQGAEALIFDVRNNPGGYKKELVQVLNYLLPEGPLFRSLSYTGKETVDSSDADCLEMPMAVLMNGSSYSAAEFFAAALDEYDWAILVGEATTGKGYFQNTFQLTDGSAAALSVGKYFTPNGVSLADEGGLTPEIAVEVDDRTAASIYAGTLSPEDDPQVQAAVAALLEQMGK